MFVANIEAEELAFRRMHRTHPNRYNSHRMMASVSVIPVPGGKIKTYTRLVEESNGFSGLH
jgi:hypothetical protein